MAGVSLNMKIEIELDDIKDNIHEIKGIIDEEEYTYDCILKLYRFLKKILYLHMDTDERAGFDIETGKKADLELRLEKLLRINFKNDFSDLKADLDTLEDSLYDLNEFNNIVNTLTRLTAHITCVRCWIEELNKDIDEILTEIKLEKCLSLAEMFQLYTIYPPKVNGS